MKFAYKLQELRKGCGMSQEELAELLGVSRQSVSKWESGKGYPEIEKLIFISHYFNTSLDLLLKDNEEPSTPISTKSTKSTRVSKKKKSRITLTKPEDVTSVEPPVREDTSYTVFEDTSYADDPTPTKSHENLSLKSVSVASNAQVGTFKNHQFGFNTTKRQRRKLSRNAKIILVAWLLGASIIGFVGHMISASSTFDNACTSVEVTSYGAYYEDTATSMDDAESLSDDTSGNWSNLYDGKLTSMFEQSMLNSINSQGAEKLITVDGDVYYSGYDIVDTYITAQYYMQMDLDYYALYQKYLSLQELGSYVDVYSETYQTWVVMPKELLRTYVSQNENYPSTVTTYTPEYDDILTNPNYYLDDYGYSMPIEPVENVSYEQGNAMVSSDVLELCIQAMEDRKQDLNMEQYIQEIKNLGSKCVRVVCTDRCDDESISCFVPKEYIMVNLSDYEGISNDDNNVTTPTDTEILESNESIEDNESVENDEVIEEVVIEQADE
jgi:transcriptional regulator with XRE-family HTH domain